MSDPRVIYLQPQCTCGSESGMDFSGDHVGRFWAEDDVWSGSKCDECGERLPDATRYVLAPLPTAEAET